MLCCLCIYSKQGLLSHVFSEPGVFYYSDQNFQEAAEYIGTVIVKPKPKEHRVMVTENGFDPGTSESRQIHRSVLDFFFFLNMKYYYSYCNEILKGKKMRKLLKELYVCVIKSG